MERTAVPGTDVLKEWPPWGDRDAHSRRHRNGSLMTRPLVCLGGATSGAQDNRYYGVLRIFTKWIRRAFKSRTPRKASYRPRLELLEGREVPAAGILDPTFGSGGLVMTNVNFGGVSDDYARSVVQADG